MVFADDIDLVVHTVDGHGLLVCHLPRIRYFVVMACLDDLLPCVVGKDRVVGRLKRDIIPRPADKRPALLDVVHSAVDEALPALHGVGRAVDEGFVCPDRHGNITGRIDLHVLWEHQSWANTTHRSYSVVAIASILTDAPRSVLIGGIRGAEPPVGGRAVQFCNAIAVSGRSGSGCKII